MKDLKIKDRFSVIDNEKIKTFQITIDDAKLNKLKEHLKSYSIITETEVKYDFLIYNLESYVTCSPCITCDEYAGICDGEINKEVENKAQRDSYDKIKNKTRKVKLKYYPFLYKILFDRPLINFNLFELLYLYLKNDPQLLEFYNSNQLETIKNIYKSDYRKYIKYDQNISHEDKLELVLEILRLINPILIHEEEVYRVLQLNDAIKEINTLTENQKEELININKSKITKALLTSQAIGNLKIYLQNSVDNQHTVDETIKKYM